MITENLESNFRKLPFVLCAGRLLAVRHEPQTKDTLTSEDPVPAAVMVNPAGCVLERKTRYTFVESETSDDN